MILSLKHLHSLILTQPICFNYGGLLQAFALQKVLRQIGWNPITLQWVFGQYSKVGFSSLLLRFWREFYLKFRGVTRNDSLRHALTAVWTDWCFQRTGWKKEHRLYNRIRIISRRTDMFTRKHLSLTPLYLLPRDLPKLKTLKADAYIVGSDQVWRKAYIPDAGMFFLDFVQNPNAVKIAYAASFGLEEPDLSAKEIAAGADCLKTFQAVSAREESGVKILRERFKLPDVQWMPDPTFLLKADIYRKLAGASKTDKAHLFCYILDDSTAKRRLIKSVAAETGLYPQIITLPNPYQGLPQIHTAPGVEEWLCGIRDASFVITDSFHGIVFSLIFEKPFLALGNPERGMARFQYLLHIFGLEHRLISQREDINAALLEEKIDFGSVRTKLKELRERGNAYLSKHLSGEK